MNRKVQRRLIVFVLVIPLLGAIVSVSAAESDYDKYILKASSSSMIFDTELAETARRMSHNAYGAVNPDFEFDTKQGDFVYQFQQWPDNWTSDILSPENLSPLKVQNHSAQRTTRLIL